MREAPEVADPGVQAHRLVEQLTRPVQVALDAGEEAGGLGEVRVQQRPRHAAAKFAESCAVLQSLFKRSELELPQDQPPQAASHANRLVLLLEQGQRLERELFDLL